MGAKARRAAFAALVVVWMLTGIGALAAGAVLDSWTTLLVGVGTLLGGGALALVVVAIGALVAWVDRA